MQYAGLGFSEKTNFSRPLWNMMQFAFFASNIE